MSLPARTLATIAITLLLLGSIGLALWEADGRYGLPTPRPPALVQPASIAPDVLARLRAAAGARSPAEPLLVHFYNPDCPCSRFNRDHVVGLVDEFGARVAQLALIELPADEPPAAVRRDEDLGMNALSENDGLLARALGVYSTPQAVLIDGAGRVYFRGNYNQSRFFTRYSLGSVRASAIEERHGPPLELSVLLAEDNLVNQRLALRVLEKLGCRSEVAADGHEVLRLWAAGRHDVILMDCQMPGMDGLQATQEIRKRESAGRHTPIVALTANAMAGDRELCLAAGMDEYVTKPFRADTLREVLLRLCTAPPSPAH
jgi:CheY-like chemotaxis protein